MPQCALCCAQTTDKSAVETAIDNAKEQCESGSTGECAAAWDEVMTIVTPVLLVVHQLLSTGILHAVDLRFFEAFEALAIFTWSITRQEVEGVLQGDHLLQPRLPNAPSIAS